MAILKKIAAEYMDKKSLRNIYLEQRLKLSEEAYTQANEAILHQVQQLNWQNINAVHLFLSISEKREINTFPILDWLLQQHPHIQILIPRADFTTGRMEQVIYTSDVPINKKKYHIPEPIGGKIVNPSTIDRVFIPLLCFDQQGYRVGYGKGFYDRFLQTCKLDVEKIGLSFFDPIVKISDTDIHDIPLNRCISPNRIYDFH